MPADVPGRLSTALDIKVSSNIEVFTDTISDLQSDNFYRFGLQVRSSFYLSLNRFRGDLNVELIKDVNNDGVAQADEVIAFSSSPGRIRESISADLDRGTYYIRVYGEDNAFSFYNLSVLATPESDAIPSIPVSSHIDSSTPLPNSLNGIVYSILQPSSPSSTPLGAETFTYQRNSQTTFVSGRGNIDFGIGKRDILDLSAVGINSGQVSFNWATLAGGGVKANPGNGERIFDAITINDGISNGYQILFEGIEQIQFQDITFDLAVNTPGLDPATKATIVPNDEKFKQQWNLHVTGIHNAWRFTTGSAGVLIGVVDSGLAVNTSGQTHPDLRSTIFVGDNYKDESETFSHGTLVQSVIAGAANNGIGIAGVNWNSDVAHIDVLGGNAGDKDLAEATRILINLANQKNQKLVVNLSLSGGTTQAFIDLVAANSNNVLFVAAAGNENVSTVSNPGALAATYGNVISVGSSWGNTDYYGIAKTPGQRIDYSSRNPELTPQAQIAYHQWWGSNHTADKTITTLTLMAPAEYPAANADKSGSTFTFNYSDKFTGTSASTPIVTGAASLVWSINPNLTATQVRNILTQTAVDLGESGYDRFYGHGFINADAAVRAALATTRA
ncbi:MAG: S8 family serine peptidase [Calothrix sp. C42_A2020_038]|nr:S8 family serine peptidase [Calothrix sp. C42_A2020_038]